MTSSHRRWTLDLLLVVAGAIAALAVVLLGIEGSLVRSLFVVPLIVLYPGYALLAVIFPERRSEVDSDRLGPDLSLTRPARHTAGLLYSVRLILSATASLALVAGVALLTNALGRGFDAAVVGFGVFVLTVVLTAVAFARRASLPSDVRAGLPALSSVFGAVSSSSGGQSSSLSAARRSPVPLVVNALVVLSLLVFLSSVGFAMVETQDPDAEFTEAYLVTENETGYTASDYPRQLSQGETTEYTLALESHEQEPTTYTVVTELQRTEQTANGTQVAEEEELSRTRHTVEDGETAYLDREVQPTMSGDGLRLVFHVYEGEAPENADRESAYRTVQLVVSVGGDDPTQFQRQSSGGGTVA
ncbi:DUF1616 domain-containing protein [Halobellus rufus]|uniref:DUF1616 domain-containing protein n=1 Tax=Halobellus rufus TaxID=1448860 RepID=UPI000679547C|nr:DUF1616 domain-containing protein [Halobellus rufus]